MSVAIPGLRDTDPMRLANAIRQLAEGRSNAVGSATLAPGGTSTVVEATNCSPDSVVLLTAKTATAAAATGVYVVAGKGQFTIYHDSSAATDRTFGFETRG
ncbi:hypothetical protein [Xanthobacter versatilis]|uniref:hypothetical protein n=1 Tax=Xanthobacter autotrophicus (strain ATCC BAA-1158 / Py2) TaxID=78245 RepID=UPI003727515C